MAKQYIDIKAVNKNLFEIMQRAEYNTNREDRMDLLVAVCKAYVGIMAIDMQAEIGGVNPEGLVKASQNLVIEIANEFNESFGGDEVPEEDIALAKEQKEKE